LVVDIVTPIKLRAVIPLALSRRQVLQFLGLDSSQPMMWLMGSLTLPHTLPGLQYAKSRLNVARSSSCHYESDAYFYLSGLVVEDAIAGLKAGKASGALTLAVCTSTERAILEAKGKPDYIVRDLTW